MSEQLSSNLNNLSLRTPRLLSELQAGICGVVCQLMGGRDFTARVAALGFTIGAEVTVLQNYGRGPLIVLVRGTRVALGRGEALKIQVLVG